MKIVWHGGSTIELKIGASSVILNPTSEKQIEGMKAAIYDTTQESLPKVEGAMAIDWPGEYDVSEFSFKAIEVHGKKGSQIIYNFFSESGNVAWMGELQEYPDEKLIESLGDIHALIVPVAGDNVLTAKDAFRLVEAVEPMVVIPVCFDANKDGLAAFIKEMDVEKPSPTKSFELKRSALSGEQMDLVILQ